MNLNRDLKQTFAYFDFKKPQNIFMMISYEEKLLKNLTSEQKAKINALPYKVLSNGATT